jgi:hypothetical protein
VMVQFLRARSLHRWMAQLAEKTVLRESQIRRLSLNGFEPVLGRPPPVARAVFEQVAHTAILARALAVAVRPLAISPYVSEPSSN